MLTLARASRATPHLIRCKTLHPSADPTRGRARRIYPVINPTIHTQHSTACVTTTPTVKTRNIFRSLFVLATSAARMSALGRSKTSENTPPTNVNRNGSAPTQGALTTCVVYSGNSSSNISSGAVLPKYRLRLLHTYTTIATATATTIPAFTGDVINRRTASNANQQRALPPVNTYRNAVSLKLKLANTITSAPSAAYTIICATYARRRSAR